MLPDARFPTDSKIVHTFFQTFSQAETSPQPIGHVRSSTQKTTSNHWKKRPAFFPIIGNFRTSPKPDGTIAHAARNATLPRMAGLHSNEVKLEHYDRTWPRLFAREAAALRTSLGALALQIEHIGSTAVPDLEAKPIIDIAVQTKTFADLPVIIATMEKNGWMHKGEFGLPGRHFFTKGKPVRFHIHIVDAESPHWPRWIGFRDLLRADEKSRRAYEGLKRRLAEKFPNDRPAYTAAKSAFITNAIAKSRRGKKERTGVAERKFSAKRRLAPQRPAAPNPPREKS
jgi:GrpB-like predicted nucleotidyltransferase (UPF0157 family)